MFEVQLLLQIIINRIAIIVERRTMAAKLKWITAIVISLVNILVMCIVRLPGLSQFLHPLTTSQWIPAHMTNPPSTIFVSINKYWDRVSKIIICLVDAGLNWYIISSL